MGQQEISFFQWGDPGLFSLGKFDHDLTVLPNPGMMVSGGNNREIIQIALFQVGEGAGQREDQWLYFRLVKLYNLQSDFVRFTIWLFNSSPWKDPPF